MNLALRFVLEMAALASVAVFGWQRFDGVGGWVAAVTFPLLFMVLWGTFAVPEDPSRGGNAPVPIPGALRLALELALFATATWALHASAHTRLALVLGGATVVHYALSRDRIRWLLKR